jgi:glucose uptake protein GlcU
VRNLDFTSWPAPLSTLLGLSVITLIGVGIRLLAMQTIQQRRERENRQINERLRTLIAAYKTLGGSFTGDRRIWGAADWGVELLQARGLAGDTAMTTTSITTELITTSNIGHHLRPILLPILICERLCFVGNTV